MGQQVADRERYLGSGDAIGVAAAALDLAAKIESTVSEAIATQPLATASDRARTKDIRSNRAEEKLANRQTEVFRLGDRTPPPKVADVIPLRPKSDYSEPSITEILGSLDDDQ